MNNFQKIKSMTEEELATFIYLYFINDCNNCPADKYEYKACLQEGCDCSKLVEKWLRKRNEISTD